MSCPHNEVSFDEIMPGQVEELIKDGFEADVDWDRRVVIIYIPDRNEEV